MENIIKRKLTECYDSLGTFSPMKKQQKEVYVGGGNISELLDIVENIVLTENIDKNDIRFISNTNYSMDGDIIAIFDIEVPKTKNDLDIEKEKKFKNKYFKVVFDEMIKKGYKRVGFSSHLLKEFDDTTVFKMFLNKDFDRLTKYFSIFFVK
jgi:hypothetical protein